MTIARRTAQWRTIAFAFKPTINLRMSQILSYSLANVITIHILNPVRRKKITTKGFNDMFRQIKNNLPDVAERMLIALYAMTSRIEVEEGTPPDWIAFVEGRGVAKIIGGEWSSYRHSVMLKLQESEWVICKKGVVRGTATKEVWRYALTCKAFETLDNRVIEGLKGWFMGYETSKPNMLPGFAEVE